MGLIFSRCYAEILDTISVLFECDAEKFLWFFYLRFMLILEINLANQICPFSIGKNIFKSSDVHTKGAKLLEFP